MIKSSLFNVILLLSLLWSCKKAPQLTSAMEDSFYLRNSGADMPVFVNGNGSSKVFILLLHGGPGDGGLKYRHHEFSNLLEEQYAMVYWDQRHQGDSQGHLTESEITIDAMVEDTHLIIQALKKRYGSEISVFLMGHSWGGLLGTAYMLKDDYQTEVNGWIESGGAHDFPLMNVEIVKKINSIGPAEIDAGHHTIKWVEILDYVSTIDTANISSEQASKLNEYAGVCETLIHELYAKTEPDVGDFETFFFSPTNPLQVTLNGNTLPSSFYEEIIHSSYTSQLDKITTPTLLLWGKYDFKVPSAIAERAYEKINTAHKYLKIYDHAGHSSMRYVPELFVQDIITFVEQYK